MQLKIKGAATYATTFTVQPHPSQAKPGDVVRTGAGNYWLRTNKGTWVCLYTPHEGYGAWMHGDEVAELKSSTPPYEIISHDRITLTID